MVPLVPHSKSTHSSCTILWRYLSTSDFLWFTFHHGVSFCHCSRRFILSWCSSIFYSWSLCLMSATSPDLGCLSAVGKTQVGPGTSKHCSDLISGLCFRYCWPQQRVLLTSESSQGAYRYIICGFSSDHGAHKQLPRISINVYLQCFPNRGRAVDVVAYRGFSVPMLFPTIVWWSFTVKLLVKFPVETWRQMRDWHWIKRWIQPAQKVITAKASQMHRDHMGTVMRGDRGSVAGMEHLSLLTFAIFIWVLISRMGTVTTSNEHLAGQ